MSERLASRFWTLAVDGVRCQGQRAGIEDERAATPIDGILGRCQWVRVYGRYWASERGSVQDVGTHTESGVGFANSLAPNHRL